MDFINDKKHLRISSTMMNSKYYNYVLSSTDIKVFLILWDKVLAPNSKYYKRGQLVVNIKQETMSGITGLSIATIKRSIKKLDMLGAIVIIRQHQNNNRYLIGFRTRGNEWLLFLYHLIDKFESLLSEYIDEELYNGKVPVIKDINMYRMNSACKNYIIKNFNSKYFFTTAVENDKGILEFLFDRKDFYFAPELIVVPQRQTEVSK